MAIKQRNTAPISNKTAQGLQQLAIQISSVVGDAEDYATDIPGLMLYRRTAPTVAGSTTYEPSVTVVVQGKKRVHLGATTFNYDASRYLLTSIDLPVLGQVIEASPAKPYLCMVLKLEMPLVRELLSKEDVPEGGGDNDGPAMTTGENTADFLGACYRLLDLLNTPQDIPYMSSLIQREIIYRILRGPEGGRLRAIATQGLQSHRTAKAISWIRNNYAKPLKVEYLAKLAGMGVSTLHHHFRTMTALSPIQYQKQMRLHTARTLMLVDGVDAATAAFQVGYESASQFNREYSRYFGQPPLRDIQSIKSASS